MSAVITKERLVACSDAIFAVVVTIMALQLHPPDHPSIDSLLGEWPTAVSYVVSYFFIIIMWMNHHYLWSFAKESRPVLIFWNFAHMLSASLVPFITAWVAETRIASVPVAVYAATIVLVNISYHGFANAVIPKDSMDRGSRRRALTRSVITIGLFGASMIVAMWLPLVAFGLVSCVLVSYLRLDTPVFKRHRRED